MIPRQSLEHLEDRDDMLGHRLVPIEHLADVLAPVTQRASKLGPGAVPAQQPLEP